MTDKYGIWGNYQTWEEAQLLSDGFNAEVVLEKVRAATLRVKNGEAAGERDSVNFDKIQYSWPLAACIMHAAANLGGELRVLDFGGSLGSVYFQLKKFLSALDNVSWSVVEQAHYVKTGNAEIADELLSFFSDIATCTKQTHPNIIVLSSVLHYIPQPYELLKELFATGINHLVIDRNGFSLTGRDIIKLQIVPPKVYDAKMVLRFFAEDNFLLFFQENGWELIESFPCEIDHPGEDYCFKGMYFIRH